MMTLDSRYTIEPGDIGGLEFECKGCGATASRPLDKFTKLPYSCGNCGQEFLKSPSLHEQSLRQIAEQLAYLVKAADELKFRVRFQVRGIPNQSA